MKCVECGQLIDFKREFVQAAYERRWQQCGCSNAKEATNTTYPHRHLHCPPTASNTLRGIANALLDADTCVKGATEALAQARQSYEEALEAFRKAVAVYSEKDDAIGVAVARALLADR